MPVVSIIVSCYNQARFVRQAVASALAQDYTRCASDACLDIVIVDDGSTDDPHVALGELLDDPRVQYIRQENRGAAAARNRGLRAASGELVKFLDADDWLDPTIVRRQAELLRVDSRMGWVYSDYWRCDEAGQVIARGKVGERWTQLDGDLYPLLLLSGFFPPVTLMVRQSALQAIGGFDETLQAAEDYDLCLRLAANGYAARFIPDALAYYRVHSGGKSQNRERALNAYRRIILKLIQLYPQQTTDALSAINGMLNQARDEQGEALGSVHYYEQWLAQAQADKALLEHAAAARETYLVRLEQLWLFRILLRLGLFPRRA